MELMSAQSNHVRFIDPARDLAEALGGIQMHQNGRIGLLYDSYYTVYILYDSVLVVDPDYADKLRLARNRISEFVKIDESISVYRQIGHFPAAGFYILRSLRHAGMFYDRGDNMGIAQICGACDRTDDSHVSGLCRA